MDKIYFVTTNKGKIASIARDLENTIEVVPVPIDIPEPRSDETSVIAIEKATKAFEQLKNPCIAQDGGFYIPSLNGFPKAFVNFAVDTIGIEGILKLVEGKNRNCEFRDTLAYMDETLDKPILFETITDGILSDKPRGELHEYNWGDLHKIFIPNGLDKTLSEMSAKDMDSWRQSKQDDWCGRQFARWLRENKL